MRLKLDLHTHCLEATNTPVPGLEEVSRIVAMIEARGLHGIAVTDHEERGYGFRVKEMVERHFNGKVLIIPGQEISVGYEHVVELYLSPHRVFRFWAHPRFVEGFNLDFLGKDHLALQGIESRNGNWHVDGQRVNELAQRYGLMLLENSDAHSLQDIGCHYNEVDLAELWSRALPQEG